MCVCGQFMVFFHYLQCLTELDTYATLCNSLYYFNLVHLFFLILNLETLIPITLIKTTSLDKLRLMLTQQMETTSGENSFPFLSALSQLCLSIYGMWCIPGQHSIVRAANELCSCFLSLCNIFPAWVPGSHSPPLGKTTKTIGSLLCFKICLFVYLFIVYEYLPDICLCFMSVKYLWIPGEGVRSTKWELYTVVCSRNQTWVLCFSPPPLVTLENIDLF